MKAKALLLLVLPFLVGGCLFTVNQPLVGPDGTVALMLGEEGGYSLLLETGQLNLLSGEEWRPVPGAAFDGPASVADWSSDGSEVLVLSLEGGLGFEPMTSGLTIVPVDPAAEDSPRVVLRSDDPIVRAAYVSDGRLIVLRYLEEGFGELQLLDPATGELESLADDVLSFELGPDRETLTLIVAETQGNLAIAHIGRWNPRTDERYELGSFVLNEQTIETFLLVSHSLLWDVDPSGRWIALALYDHVLIDPPFEDDAPTLYLIDTEEGSTVRLAAMGIMPTFSSDGALLAYIGSDDGETSHAMVCHTVAPEEPRRVDGGEGAAACFWLRPGVLLLAFEGTGDAYSLVRFDLLSGTSRPLFE